MLRSNTPLSEEIRTTALTVPILFKFKHQFGSVTRAGKLGISAAAGPVIGFYNQTRSTASGSFSYEAIYKLNGNQTAKVSGFDSSFTKDKYGISHPGDPKTSLVITEYNHRGDGPAADHLDMLSRSENNYNVGLNKSIAPSRQTQTVDIRQIAIGAMIQAGASYQISDYVAFHLEGYYMYQQWRGKENTTYKPTTGVKEEGGAYYANYSAMTNGIKSSSQHSYGVAAGLRFFFGELRDMDADGIADRSDICPLNYGIAKFNGCPDSDNDGTPDSEDGCPNNFGPETTGGCPDSDGDIVPDKDDSCPDEYGILRNGCPISELAESAPVDNGLTRENGEQLPPQIVLETNVLHFEFARADIRDSTAGVLDYAASILATEPKVVVHISGFTDDIGSAINNERLSYQRARNARSYLVKQGVEESRIIISGYGMSNPARPNTSDENRAKNRRIELKLLLPL